MTGSALSRKRCHQLHRRQFCGVNVGSGNAGPSRIAFAVHIVRDNQSRINGFTAPPATGISVRYKGQHTQNIGA
ncbi:hypothetical protein MJ572_03415 [Escherichia coli]|nr:hypothetical protein MJ572_03415 [Escherichia coli]